MSVKDLFGKKSNKLVTSQQSEQIVEEVESQRYMEAEVESRHVFVPKIDFSDPANFVRYGSAKKYYSDSIQHIYQEYPYDGSLAEKREWHNSASYLDNYLFENEYPRTTGYLLLNGTPAVDDSYNDGVSLYTLLDDPQYIYVKGGPNENSEEEDRVVDIFEERGGDANIYDVEEMRESNLEVNGDNGTTVEFWNKPTVSPTSADCVFDVWNGVELIEPRDPDYGRFMVEVLPQISANDFFVTYAHGSDGVERLALNPGTNIALDEWRHLAFTAENYEGQIRARLYINGELIDEAVGGTEIGEIDVPHYMNCGAYLHAPTVLTKTNGVGNGWGSPEQNYVDELRFWKTARSSKEIGRYWFTQVGGGTNRDEASSVI